MTPTAAIPLFPLASVVLFPHLRVPLYIFEPRYRQMTEAALAGDRLIAMVTVVPDQRDAMAGDPDVYAIGCAGHIETCERRGDGTYDITLLGKHRIEIERELERPEGQLYRTAAVQILADEDAASDPSEVARLRAEVHRRYGEWLERTAPGYVERFRSTNFAAIPPSLYANSISLSLTVDPIEKQSLLEASSTRARLERLLAVLDFELAQATTRGPLNPTTLQ